jgi:hypothetical protein
MGRKASENIHIDICYTFFFTTTFAIRISSYIKNVRLRTDGIDKYCFTDMARPRVGRPCRSKYYKRVAGSVEIC